MLDGVLILCFITVGRWNFRILEMRMFVLEVRTCTRGQVLGDGCDVL